MHACSIDSIIILHVLVLDLGVVGAHKREAPAPIYSGLVLTYQIPSKKNLPDEIRKANGSFQK